ncbi:MAG TPA: hypothetical protein VD793_06245 [Gemmatimonadales bacterium]|nr:hypothetical protein [Gemmatimonadales bacterium]
MIWRSWFSLRIALAVGAAIHLDWHVARPLHHRLSLGWSLHWSLAVPLFLAIGWYAARRWPRSPWRPALLSVATGVLLGEVAEPVGEVLFAGAGLAEVYAAERTRAFTQFMVAGLAALVAGALAGLRPSGPSALGDPS